MTDEQKARHDAYMATIRHWGICWDASGLSYFAVDDADMAKLHTLTDADPFFRTTAATEADVLLLIADIERYVKSR